MSITGSAVVGGTLTAVDPDSNWTNNAAGAMTPSYQWQADGVDIPGATSTTLAVTADLIGSRLSLVATRTNAVGATSATSVETATVPETARLSNLSLSVSQLVPGFTGGVTSYGVTVPVGVASLSLTPTAAEPGATITVDGVDVASAAPHTVALAAGTTTVVVRVSFEGRVTEYVVVVSRQPSGVRPRPTAPVLVLSPDGGPPALGEANARIAGEGVAVTTTPDPGTGGVDVAGPAFSVRVVPQDVPQGIRTRGVTTDLALVRGASAKVVGEGFVPNSPVRLWLFGQPQVLGTFMTDFDGRLSVSTAAVDAATSSCQHSLHLEGSLVGGAKAAVSVGAWIDADPYPFADVGLTSAHARPIACLADLGVIHGKGDGVYDETGSLLRGQTASLVTRMLGIEASGPAPFTDTAGDPHAAAIAAAVEGALMRGFADGTFRSSVAITRGQLATLLANAAEVPTGVPATFTDTAGSVHAGAIAALAELGVIDGFADGTFRPDQPVTRGQAASLLLRVRSHVESVQG